MIPRTSGSASRFVATDSRLGVRSRTRADLCESERVHESLLLEDDREETGNGGWRTERFVPAACCPIHGGPSSGCAKIFIALSKLNVSQLSAILSALIQQQTAREKTRHSRPPPLVKHDSHDSYLCWN